MPRVRSAAPTLAPGALLQLMWLASPALPVGGFSYSEALEPAVESGLVTDEATATRWVVDQLRLGQARADLAVIASAMTAWRDADAVRLAELNAWVLTTRESAELRQQVRAEPRQSHCGGAVVAHLQRRRQEEAPGKYANRERPHGLRFDRYGSRGHGSDPGRIQLELGRSHREPFWARGLHKPQLRLTARRHVDEQAGPVPPALKRVPTRSS